MPEAETDPRIRIALLQLQHAVAHARAAVSYLPDSPIRVMLGEIESELSLALRPFAPPTDDERAAANGHRWRHLEAATLGDLQEQAMTWTRAVRDHALMEVVQGWDRANVETTPSGFRLRVQARY